MEVEVGTWWWFKPGQVYKGGDGFAENTIYGEKESLRKIEIAHVDLNALVEIWLGHGLQEGGEEEEMEKR